MNALVSLNQLSVGQIALVDSVIGPTAQAHRLDELGLRRDAEVEMIQPGSPCVIRLAGAKLCFRSDELLTVFVRPLTWSGSAARVAS
jgi:ferrous iron transport protein A